MLIDTLLASSDMSIVTPGTTTSTPSMAAMRSASEMDDRAAETHRCRPSSLTVTLPVVVVAAAGDQGVDLVGHRAEDDQGPDADRDAEDREVVRTLRRPRLRRSRMFVVPLGPAHPAGRPAL